jgi:putrescine aminotransferase
MFELFQRHMLAVYTLNNPLVIRLMPPLVISDHDFEDGLARLQEAVEAVSSVAAELTGGA